MTPTIKYTDPLTTFDESASDAEIADLERRLHDATDAEIERVDNIVGGSSVCAEVDGDTPGEDEQLEAVAVHVIEQWAGDLRIAAQYRN